MILFINQLITGAHLLEPDTTSIYFWLGFKRVIKKGQSMVKNPSWWQGCSPVISVWLAGLAISSMGTVDW
jgi:hypothetical protein